MPINWPNTPTQGQQHTEEGKTWEWDGAVWFIVTGTSSGGLPPVGPLDVGKALAVDGTGAAAWGADINPTGAGQSQLIDSGGF